MDAMELVRRDPTDEEHVLDAIIAVGFYHDPRLRTLIHGLKYQSGTCLLPSIANLLRRMKTERRDPWPWAGESGLAIQSVVGASDRIRARGFDQADLIRDLVRDELVPWAETASLLVRDRSVQPQAELEAGPLRAANVHGAFHLNPHRTIPRAVLLVDDVFTTGSTMREAARVLRDAGVQKIYGIVLALGA